MTFRNDREKSSTKILVVDDEEDIRTVIKKGLAREGLQVDTSGNPQDVLENFEPGRYDLLLVDIRMPGISGFELYRRIRKLDRKVKICFITAFEIYFDEFRRVFPKLHVSCFIRKPVTISQLAQIVRDELARAPTEEEDLATPKQRIKEQFDSRP